MATISLQNMQLDACAPIHFVESVRRHNSTENSQPSKLMELPNLVAAKRQNLSMPSTVIECSKLNTVHLKFIRLVLFIKFIERKCSLTIIFNVLTVITRDPKNAKTDFFEVQTGKFSIAVC